ncbi:hypothetical protein N658DRAFT_497286 [Parathielavia hyrcaniae]|uniref:Uncharacterized protein n=1 Tax=Parathielavia hyrcaniae TaxID=113614 RepID=A0AAN6PYZ5_9PEZI|nr:hypothetical protein N658DRAFT_497286 [Parathielavia hyrcaniae]
MVSIKNTLVLLLTALFTSVAAMPASGTAESSLGLEQRQEREAACECFREQNARRGGSLCFEVSPCLFCCAGWAQQGGDLAFLALTLALTSQCSIFFEAYANHLILPI